MSPIDELPWSQWLQLQRWYAGRNRTLVSARPDSAVTLRDGLQLALVDVVYTDEPAERYLVVVQWDSQPLAEYGQLATIGAVDEHTAYDALYQVDSARLLLSLIDSSAEIGDVRFIKEPGAVLPTDSGAR